MMYSLRIILGNVSPLGNVGWLFLYEPCCAWSILPWNLRHVFFHTTLMFSKDVTGLHQITPKHVHWSFVCLVKLSGFTPLMYACESGNAECVKLLLKTGASIKCVVSGIFCYFFYSRNHGKNKLLINWLICPLLMCNYTVKCCTFIKHWIHVWSMINVPLLDTWQIETFCMLLYMEKQEWKFGKMQNDVETPGYCKCFHNFFVSPLKRLR